MRSRVQKQILTPIFRPYNSLVKTLSYESIPRAPKWPLVGSLPYFIKAGGPLHLHNYIDNIHNQVGPIFVNNLGGSELLFISDPDANIQVYRNEGKYPEHFLPEAWTLYLQETGRKRGLFFMDGQEWAENRSILNKYLLKPSLIKSHISVLSSVTDDLVNLWKTRPPERNLERDLYCWNIDCIGTIAFGKRLGILQEVANGEKSAFVDAIHSIFKESAHLSLLPPQIARFLRLPVWRRFMSSVDTALTMSRQYAEQGISDHQFKPHVAGDEETLLGYLLRQNVNTEMITRLLADLLLAAADTTSQTATWAIYILGTNREVFEKARSEVQNMIASEDSVGMEIGANSLDKLTYMKGLIKETMRLYPVAPFLTRKLANDTVLDGYAVPAGKMIITSVMSMGRNPVYFPDPLKVKPERWLRQKNVENLCPKSSDHCPIPKSIKSAYVPWGLGARSCIGKRIAETEILILLTRLLQEFDWTVEDEVVPVQRMITVPSKDVILKFSTSR